MADEPKRHPLVNLSPSEESRRLAALKALEILDTDFEPEYDGIVKIAAQIAKCPIALISLVDADRQWFKASLGIDIRQTSRETSFCSHALGSDDPLTVPDARVDQRFRNNELVLGAPNIRFYMGFPIRFTGERLGTLCLIDKVPRVLDDDQVLALSELARTVSALFQSHQRLVVLGARDRLLEELSNEVPGAIFRFQLNPDGSTCFPFATRGLREIYGLEPEEVRESAQKVFDVIHPDDVAILSAAFARSAETLEGWRAEYRVRIPGMGVGWREGQATPERRPDGSIVWHGYVSDITDRKIAEAQLQRSQEQAAMVIEAAGLGTAVWDSAGREVSFDAITAKHYGRPELAGTMSVESWLGAIVESDRERVRQSVAEVVKLAEPREANFRVMRADGVIRYLEGHARPIRDSFSDVVQIVGVTRDVTERHEAERAQRQADAAAQANLAKTQLLGRVSHELRTPLNAILGFAQILAQSSAVQGDSTAREQVSRVSMAGWQLLELINGLLELTQAETGRDRMQLDSVNVESATAQVVDLLGGLANSRDVRITVGNKIKDLCAIADKQRLLQSLINLVSNAIKYNRTGGSVALDAESIGGNVIVRVRDTGPGLSPEQLALLGQPFSRLGAEFSDIEGSGLGLAITRSLVERMGGDLLIKSEVGVGSEFSIVLLSAGARPADIAASLEPVAAQVGIANPPFAPRALGLEPRVVLYVEDNALNRMVMHGLFEQRPDWKLLLAGNGRECMEILADATPDLILLDMRLPDCTGLELFGRILQDKRLAGLPVVAISADALPEKVSAAKSAGILDYWVKPVDLAKVHQFLTQLAERKG